MPRYFRYKSPADLLRDADSLGVSLRLSDDLGPLRRPIEVAGRRVGNRLAIQPMEGCDASTDGVPGELTLRRYQRFGAGGAKLIWGEAAAVVPEGRANPRQLVVSEAHLPALAELVATCRAAHRADWGDDSDLLVGLQLTHSGRYSVPQPRPAQRDAALDPRTKNLTPGTPLLSDEDLCRLQDRYVEAAAIARRADFDFVDLKQCHRYLLNELLSARERPGPFGGSFENRTRFIRELVAQIREREPDLLIATRLNVFDGLPYVRGADGRGEAAPHPLPFRTAWGTRENDPSQPDLAEPIALIGQLRDLGVSLVNITLGNPYASPHLLRPFEYPPPDGYETPEHPLLGVDRHFQLTARVQAAYPDLAVVGSGYSWLQAFLLPAGAANVAEGRVTFVGVGRASLAGPEIGRALAEGRPLDPRRVCRTFSYCTALMRAKHNAEGQFPTGCPPFDKEVYGPIWREAQRAEPTSSATGPLS